MDHLKLLIRTQKFPCKGQQQDTNGPVNASATFSDLTQAEVRLAPSRQSRLQAQ